MKQENICYSLFCACLSFSVVVHEDTSAGVDVDVDVAVGAQIGDRLDVEANIIMNTFKFFVIVVTSMVGKYSSLTHAACG